VIVTSTGIVLNRIKYGESGLIVKIFTKDYGLNSFLVQGVRRKNARLNSLLFQPFSLIKLSFYQKQNNTLNKLKEAEYSILTDKVISDPRKTSIATFLSEVFLNCLHENEADVEFYEFLNHSSLLLNEIQDNLKAFSPWILLKSTKYFGFKPRFNRSSTARFFNLQTGDFITNQGELNTLSANDSDVLLTFYNAPYPNNKLFQSLDLLAIALKYYQLQNQSFRNLKTLEVLKSVFA
jgi:DNA repair protein RecO (recombination protein O)